jgi:hypothetical protein
MREVALTYRRVGRAGYSSRAIDFVFAGADPLAKQ